MNSDDKKPEAFTARPEDRAEECASERVRPKGSYAHRSGKKDFMEGVRYGLLVAMQVCDDHRKNALVNVASYGAASEQQKAQTAYGIGIGAEKIAAVLRRIYAGRERLPIKS